MDKGHWEGVEPDPIHNFGFIYLISDLTSGRLYVGKKQYWKAKRGVCGCKSKVMDKSSTKWKPMCWEESDWRTYKGSSATLRDHIKKFPDNQFKFEIIRNVTSKGLLTYWETKEQWSRDVLTAKMDDGVYLYFNQSVSALRYRPNLGD